MGAPLGQAMTPKAPQGRNGGFRVPKWWFYLSKINVFVKNACFAYVKQPFLNWKATARRKVAKTI